MRVPTAFGPDATVVPARVAIGLGPRPVLVLSVAVALVAGTIGVVRAPVATIDPDLVRVIRCMALIKGGLALAALAACFWRLGRPAAGWRRFAYVAGPPSMLGGAVALWTLHGVGLAALGLHLGLFGVLAAGLTDPAFFDGWRRRRA